MTDNTMFGGPVRAVYGASGDVVGLGVGGDTVLIPGVPGNGLVIIGDSLSAQGYVTTAAFPKTQNHIYWPHALSMLKWPLRLVNMAAVSGRTIQQVLAGFDSEVAAYQPAWVWCLVGTNNCGLATAESDVADLQSIAAKCRGIGAKLLLCTIPPRDSAGMSSQIQKDMLVLNRGIRAIGRNGDAYIADIHAALHDPTTSNGAAASLMLHDGVHTSAYGAQLSGAEVARSLSGAIIPCRDAVQGNWDCRQVHAESRQLITNPKCQGTAGTTPGSGGAGTVATGWNLNRNTGSNLISTGSKISETSPRREWQRITFSGTCSGTEVSKFKINTGIGALLAAVPAGSRLRARATIRSSGISTNFKCIRLVGELQNGSSVQIVGAGSLEDSTFTQTVMPTDEFVLETPEFLYDSGAVFTQTSIYTEFTTGAASGYIDVTDVELVIVD